MPFLTTEAERDLALALGIPMYGADPVHLRFGTKSGSRRLFAEEVKHREADYEQWSPSHAPPQPAAQAEPLYF